MKTKLPKGYKPSPDEKFMNESQTIYFRKKLLDWKEEILLDSKETLNHLQEDSQKEPDIADRASSETDWSVELRTRDRQRKLITKIDAAIDRIKNGEYGFCEVSGEPINLDRLDARPIAMMSLEAQEEHEKYEKVHRDN
ncbi:MAG: RNA polymerase-binding protein DksA [Alphaproteobacteria bacterium]|nr:MAG: RNA polymerase-binding protein DksA [Alphaproteobacteria bacterium]